MLRPDTDIVSTDMQLVEVEKPHVLIDSVDAIRALVASDGDSALASKLLGIQESELLGAIVTDGTSHEILSRYIRAYSTIRAFGLLGTLTNQLSESINNNEVSSANMIKLMGSLMESVGKLTEQRKDLEQDLGLHRLLANLPQNVRGAVETLMKESGPADNEDN